MRGVVRMWIWRLDVDNDMPRDTEESSLLCADIDPSLSLSLSLSLGLMMIVKFYAAYDLLEEYRKSTTGLSIIIKIQLAATMARIPRNGR